MITVILTILYAVLLFLHIRNCKKNEKLKLEKLKLIKDELKKRDSLKIKEYYNFFNIISYIFNHYSPYTISTYLYKDNEKLNQPTVNLLYELKVDGVNDTPIFTSEHDGLPISNCNILKSAYYEKSTIFIDDIEKLDKYDNDLYMELKSKDIKRLYLFNLYPNKNCPNSVLPYAFVVLTYKEIRLDRNQISEITKKLKELGKNFQMILFPK